ncbi:MAG: putative transport system permease protein, partial [Chthoniobacter sp.]|nr:putative transport system permease protein [Chthoniobacter sp.]
MMTGLIHWVSQVLSVAFLNLRTIPERKGASIAAAVGIAGVVAVLVGVLAIAEGFRRAMTISGQPDVAVVLRSGADSEMTSGLSRDEVRVIRDAPGIARNAAGPLISAELFVIIDLPKRSTGTSANVPLRGVEAQAFDVRGDIRVVQGRRFDSGKNEIIVGAGAAREFAGLDLDKDIRVGQSTWRIVGIYTAGGGLAESEIWADGAVLQPAYHRDNYQSVYARLTSVYAFTEFKDALTTNPQLQAKVQRLDEFYAGQSTAVIEFISTFGVFIAGMMALGALFGALNTMYGAVAARTREIATLRALGFGASPVIVSVLLESVALALVGGAL